MTADRREIGIQSPFPEPFPRMRIEKEVRGIWQLPLHPEDWISEEKKNGFGAMAYVNKDAGKFALVSKNGRLFTTKWLELYETLSVIGEAHSVVFDGEIISGEGRTKEEFEDLMDRQRRKLITRKNISYVVFDILYLDGRDLRRVPLIERKRILSELFSEFPPMNVYPSDYSEDLLKTLDDAVKNKAEGVIYKKADGIYRPGAISRDQIKVKLMYFSDEETTPDQQPGIPQQP